MFFYTQNIHGVANGLACLTASCVSFTHVYHTPTTMAFTYSLGQTKPSSSLLFSPCYFFCLGKLVTLTSRCSPEFLVSASKLLPKWFIPTTLAKTGLHTHSNYFVCFKSVIPDLTELIYSHSYHHLYSYHPLKWNFKQHEGRDFTFLLHCWILRMGNSAWHLVSAQ